MSIKEVMNRWRSQSYRNTLNRIKDMNTLACAYLAEHPADDDEPVTIDWLSTCRLSPPSLMFDFWQGRDPAGGYNIRLNGSNIYMLKAETRGQVRLLCRALGIDLKEST